MSPLLVLLPIFGIPIQKEENEKKSRIIRRKTKKYILVRKGHQGALKMAKVWLRRLKNTKIGI
jgi:hypothetical protein